MLLRLSPYETERSLRWHAERLALLCLAALLSAGAKAQETVATPTTPAVHAAYPGMTTPLGQRIAELLAAPGASRAHWGIAVTTLDGTPIYGLDEGKLFRPASNAKLFTTAAAMALLGPDTRVTTVVSASASPDVDGVVQGDLILHGAGDANLSGRTIPYEEPSARSARLAREKKENAGARKAVASATAPETISELPEQGPLAEVWLPIEDLAAQLAAAGVKSLTGAVRADATLWRGPGYADSWDAGDVVWGYGAAVSPLEFNDGLFKMRLTPGAKPGDAAVMTLDPNMGALGSADLRPVNQVTTVGTPTQAFVDVLPGTAAAGVVVRGAVATGHPDEEEIAAKDPAGFAVDALTARLAAHGIRGAGSASATPSASPASLMSFSQQLRQPVSLTPRPESETSPVCGRDFDCGGAGGVVLARRLSSTVAEDVTVTLKESQNLHAEMLLRRLGRAYGTEGSFAQGSRVLRQWLLAAGMDGDDFVFYDGSGLSGHDLVTPRTTAALLLFATRQLWFASWKAALPIGGVDGTLEHRFTEPPLRGRVRAKTGTLGESRALSGFLTCNSGRQVIFSLMVDNHAPFGGHRSHDDGSHRGGDCRGRVGVSLVLTTPRLQLTLNLQRCA